MTGLAAVALVSRSCRGDGSYATNVRRAQLRAMGCRRSTELDSEGVVVGMAEIAHGPSKLSTWPIADGCAACSAGLASVDSVCATIGYRQARVIGSDIGPVTRPSAARGNASRSARRCRSPALAATQCRIGALTAPRVDQPRRARLLIGRSEQRHSRSPEPVPLVQRTGDHPDTPATPTSQPPPVVACGEAPRSSPGSKGLHRTCSTLREPLRAERWAAQWSRRDSARRECRRHRVAQRRGGAADQPAQRLALIEQGAVARGGRALRQHLRKAGW